MLSVKSKLSLCQLLQYFLIIVFRFRFDQKLLLALCFAFILSIVSIYFVRYINNNLFAHFFPLCEKMALFLFQDFSLQLYLSFCFFKLLFYLYLLDFSFVVFGVVSRVLNFSSSFGIIIDIKIAPESMEPLFIFCIMVLNDFIPKVFNDLLIVVNSDKGFQ